LGSDSFAVPLAALAGYERVRGKPDREPASLRNLCQDAGSPDALTDIVSVGFLPREEFNRDTPLPVFPRHAASAYPNRAKRLL